MCIFFREISHCNCAHISSDRIACMYCNLILCICQPAKEGNLERKGAFLIITGFSNLFSSENFLCSLKKRNQSKRRNDCMRWTICPFFSKKLSTLNFSLLLIIDPAVLLLDLKKKTPTHAQNKEQ